MESKGKAFKKFTPRPGVDAREAAIACLRRAGFVCADEPLPEGERNPAVAAFIREAWTDWPMGGYVEEERNGMGHGQR